MLARGSNDRKVTSEEINGQGRASWNMKYDSKPFNSGLPQEKAENEDGVSGFC